MRASPMNAEELALRTPLCDFTSTQLRLEEEGNCLAGSSRKRILLLSVSAGTGHVRAAQAIAAFAALRQGVEVLHIDAAEYMTPTLRVIYRKLYLRLVQRCPGLWAKLFKLTNKAAREGMLQGLRRMIEHGGMLRLLREVTRIAPDVIVCTHFLPAELLASRTESSCPVWIQITDFDVHRMWVQPGAAGYLVASTETALRLQAHQVRAERVRVTGIPIMPAFGTRHKRSDCARELGLDPGGMTVLLMGGGAGMGNLESTAKRVLDAEPSLQLIVLAGRNESALQNLHGLRKEYPGRLVALGYTEHVARVMACADLAVTKPGGLSISECLAMGLPMLLHAPIPGQEEGNADYLLDKRAAVMAHDVAELECRIRELVQDRAGLAAMAEQARRLGCADAGWLAVNAVLNDEEA